MSDKTVIVENVPFGELRSGDVVQSGYSKAGTVNVERKVYVPDLPTKLGSIGLATVRRGKEIHPNMEIHLLGLPEHNEPWVVVAWPYSDRRWFGPSDISDFRPLVARPEVTRDDLVKVMSPMLRDVGSVGFLPGFVTAVMDLLGGDPA